MLEPHWKWTERGRSSASLFTRDQAMKMSKRAFLKTTGATVAAGMLGRWSAAQQAAQTPQTQPQAPAAPPAPPPEPLHNWAGNITYSTTSVEMPATMDEVCEAVKTATKLRAVGSRHSFNTIADSTVELFSVKQIKDIAIDTKAETVTVGGGVSYGQLALVLDSKGYALHNLASLPHISVAGAIATATHGSGLNNGNLATAVTGLEIVTAEGKIAQLTREKDGDAFLGAVVGLGALGVVTHVTLKLQPSYDVAQAVYLNLPFDVLEHNFDKVFGAGYSVSLFTDWQNHRATQMWLKHRLRPDEQNVWNGDFMGAPMATENVHPITGHSAESCTEQMGMPGPWYDRLPHFKMNFTPSSGRELQSEYFVPREHAYEAILAVEKLRDKITPLLFVTELRTVAADDLWLSMAYQRPSLAIHFTWKPMWPEVKALLPRIEAALEPFEARPHWGKLFTLAPTTLDARYAKLAAYKEMVQNLDPTGKFRNEFLESNLKWA